MIKRDPIAEPTPGDVLETQGRRYLVLNRTMLRVSFTSGYKRVSVPLAEWIGMFPRRSTKVVNRADDDSPQPLARHGET